MLLAGLVLGASAFAGQVYKWVDAQGHFHFGDTPQPGWTRVDAGRTNSMTADVPQVAGEDEEKRAVHCKQKRDELAGYKSASRIVERDALGGEREFSDEQKQKLISQTAGQATEACGEDVEAAPAPAQ
ncbi:MAG: DUF4124 domain-containing protein [Solimonas sp.]